MRGKYLEPQNQKVFGILDVDQDTILNAKIDKGIRYSWIIFQSLGSPLGYVSGILIRYLLDVKILT